MERKSFLASCESCDSCTEVKVFADNVLIRGLGGKAKGRVTIPKKEWEEIRQEVKADRL